MTTQHRSQGGFTLVEIMVVVVIIGLLTSMVLPAFDKVRRTSQNAATMNGFRTFSEAFEIYRTDTGWYPVDVNEGVVPPGMADYMASSRWLERTPIGGQWDWDYQARGVLAAVSVTNPEASADQMEALDRRSDDGNLGTGVIRLNSGALMYILEE